jgi:hypothetical protein
MRNPVTISSKISAMPRSRVSCAQLVQELARLQLGLAALHRLHQHRGQVAGLRAHGLQRGRVAVGQHDHLADQCRCGMPGAIGTVRVRPWNGCPLASTSSCTPW